MGFSVRDNPFYQAWDDVSRDRERFVEWIAEHILATADFAEFRRSVGLDQPLPTPS
jgi:glutaconate CoA-transferase subunit A